jgi:hypothetical protein
LHSLLIPCSIPVPIRRRNAFSPAKILPGRDLSPEDYG